MFFGNSPSSSYRSEGSAGPKVLLAARVLSPFRCKTRLLSAVLTLTAAVAATAAEAKPLSQVPFWSTSSGWWSSDNVYFTPDHDYNVRSYNSIIEIRVESDRVTETEYKFIPPGKLAKAYGGAIVHEDDGVEVDTVTTYLRIKGTDNVLQHSVSPTLAPSDARTSIEILSKDTAVRVVREPSAANDFYRMFITMPTGDRRYMANYGFASKAEGGKVPGDLRGFSTFDTRRISADSVEALRAQYRVRNRTTILIVPNADGKPDVKRIAAR
jgi:hypothetical protein